MGERLVELEVVVESSDDAQELGAALGVGEPATVHIAKTSGFDGDVAQWILLANSTIAALSSLVAPLVVLVDRRRVRSVTVDGVHIENPTPQDVETLLRRAGVRGG